MADSPKSTVEEIPQQAERPPAQPQIDYAAELSAELSDALTAAAPAADKAEIGEDVAEELERPRKDGALLDAVDQELGRFPEGHRTRVILEGMKKSVESGGANSFTKAMMVLALLVNKYRRVLGDSIGGYGARTAGLGFKLEKEDEEKLMEPARDEERELVADDEEERNRKYGKHQDRASARYVAEAVFGLDTGKIQSADQLSSVLLNAKDKEGEKAYHRRNVSSYEKEGLPFGAVLFFRPQAKEIETITVFATGNKDEVKYYDAKSGAVIVSSVKKMESGMKLLALLVRKKPGEEAAKDVEKVDQDFDPKMRFEEMGKLHVELKKQIEKGGDKAIMTNLVSTHKKSLEELHKALDLKHQEEAKEELAEMMAKVEDYFKETENWLEMLKRS